jgi:prepilin-type N-terminal cleavage/methylation domain-containing protein
MKNNGYTLVEVLVVLSIMAVLFASGYSNYRDFSRRQAITNTSKSLQADLRLAQQTALSGNLPTDSACNGVNRLEGYLFNVVSATTYEIKAKCTGGTAAPVKTVTLTPGITIAVPFPAPNPILFKVLGQGTNINSAHADIQLVQVSSTSATTIQVFPSGQIESIASTAAPGGGSTPAPTVAPTATPGALPTATPAVVPTPTPIKTPSPSPLPTATPVTAFVEIMGKYKDLNGADLTLPGQRITITGPTNTSSTSSPSFDLPSLPAGTYSVTAVNIAGYTTAYKYTINGSGTNGTYTTGNSFNVTLSNNGDYVDIRIRYTSP